MALHARVLGIRPCSVSVLSPWSLCRPACSAPAATTLYSDLDVALSHILPVVRTRVLLSLSALSLGSAFLACTSARFPPLGTWHGGHAGLGTCLSEDATPHADSAVSRGPR